jgi:hypothetical protein
MLQTVMAVVHPELTHGVARAALIPTEPHAIAVYALVAWSIVLVWLGNRGSDVEDVQAEGEAGVEGTQDDPAPAEEETKASRASSAARGKRDRRAKRGSKKLTRAQKRRRGHIDWIQ